MRQPLAFVKSHGLGNDFILTGHRPDLSPEQWPEIARKLCQRHRGIGADGLIVYHATETADARMQILNADGSEPEMCGNGLRTFVHYLHQHHGFASTLRIETGAGILTGKVLSRDVSQALIEVEMGPPHLAPESIPALGFTEGPVLNTPLCVPGTSQTFNVSLVSMGNPHCVIPVTQIPEDWHALGEALMQHPQFPAQANIEFVVFHSPTEAEVKVWERGVGPTEACGTGACAVAVVGQLLQRLSPSCTLHLPGGPLQIRWDGINHPVYMTGPSEEVYSGIYPLEGALS